MRAAIRRVLQKHIADAPSGIGHGCKGAARADQQHREAQALQTPAGIGPWAGIRLLVQLTKELIAAIFRVLPQLELSLVAYKSARKVDRHDRVVLSKNLNTWDAMKARP